MTAASVSFHIPYRPFFQTLFVPVKLITGVFFQALGYLLLFLGASQWGKSIKEWGAKLVSSAQSLCIGLWAYGRRFLIHSDNYESACRGSCYWFMDQVVFNPDLPLEEIALHFDDAPPQAAIEMHSRQMMPAHLEEQRIWEEEVMRDWPPMPELDAGIYTFLLGYSRNARTQGQAHRVVFIKRPNESMLFDPGTGLSVWDPADWKPLLDRLASNIRENGAGFFTLQCYQYNLIENN